MGAEAAAGSPSWETRELILDTSNSMGPLEPKLFFANERTFLHWVHASLTLASVGMLLMALQDGANSYLPLALGTVLASTSVALIWYAYRTFLWRLERIRSRTTTQEIDDTNGPVLLATSVIVALLAGGCMAIF